MSALVAVVMLCAALPATAVDKYFLTVLVEGHRKAVGYETFQACMNAFKFARRYGGNPHLILTQAGFDALTQENFGTLTLLLSFGGTVLFEPAARCRAHTERVERCNAFCLQRPGLLPEPELPPSPPAPQVVLIHPEPVPLQLHFRFARAQPRRPPAVEPPPPPADQHPLEERPFAEAPGADGARAMGPAGEEGPFAAAPRTALLPPPPPPPPLPSPLPMPVPERLLPAPPGPEIGVGLPVVNVSAVPDPVPAPLGANVTALTVASEAEPLMPTLSFWFWTPPALRITDR